MTPLAVVTATTNIERAKDCIESWRAHASGPVQFRVQYDTMGTVPAFARGLRWQLEQPHDIIACLHDDLLIEQDGWDHMVLEHFATHPACGLLGFGGALGLGDSDIYQKPYNPMQLARKDFISNMRDAEAHGERVEVATQVSCLDGFSLIGRRAFWQPPDQPNLFDQFLALGVCHHGYDGMAGVYAARCTPTPWEVWMLPIQCHHFGGRTAVSDESYHAWAKTQDPNGDSGFWIASHKIFFEYGRGVLPLLR